VWRRYLGEFGKFYCTLWLIDQRHCTSVSMDDEFVKENNARMNVIHDYLAPAETNFDP